MSRVHVAHRARNDVDAVWAYIARHSEFNATRFVTRLEAKFKELAEMPGVGRPVPKLGFPDLRVATVRPYLIYYQPIADGVEIVRVIHGAMDQDAQWR